MFWQISQTIQILIAAHHVKQSRNERIITTLNYSRSYVAPTIVNGSPAAIGEVPYLVSIKEITKNVNDSLYWSNLCGGSIITPSKILTAAHCFESSNFFFLHRPHLLRIVAGSLRNEIRHSGEDDGNQNGQWRKVKSIVIHKEFQFPLHDVALVFLQVPFELDGNVDVIPVASRNKDYSGPCKAAGYGRTSHEGSLSSILRLATITALPRWHCSMMWGMNMNTYVCAGASFSDVSLGDSGSPLVCEGTEDPEEDYSKGLLVGVVCGKNFDRSSLYTRVSAYHDWIKSNDASALVSRFSGFCVLFLVTLFIKEFIYTVINIYRHAFPFLAE